MENNFSKSIKEAFEKNIIEMEDISKRLEKNISKVDIFELLSHISFLINFMPEDSESTTTELREIPLLPFLTGLCLKVKESSSNQPKINEIHEIIEDLKKYISFSSIKIMFNISKDFEINDEQYISAISSNIKLLNQVNPSAYIFQVKDYLENVTMNLNDFFDQYLGFNVNDSIIFGEKIIKRYEEKFNKKKDEVGIYREKAILEIKSDKMKETLEKRNMSTDQAIDSYTAFLLYSNLKDLFVFSLDRFCKEENLLDEQILKFKKYLDSFSSNLGEQSADFITPFDDNIFLNKPIIKYQDNYLAPSPEYLINNLAKIFENRLSNEKISNSKIWIKYEKIKSKYLEDKTYNCFKNIFNEKYIFRNLYYTYNNEECELDTLIIYDNNLLIIEQKAGNLTDPAQRGAIKRLKTDLKKLVEDAFKQGTRVKNYLKTSSKKIFNLKKDKNILEIKENINNFNFFIINITLVPLFNLVANISEIKKIGLFENNEFPWSTNINELELIMKYINHPAIFIHYLEKRFSILNNNFFHSMDELTLFSYYLEYGNFHKPLLKDNTHPDFLYLDDTWLEKFDKYYLQGKGEIKLNIEPNIIKIINDLEIKNVFGYTMVINTILDFSHETRKTMIDKINEVIELTNKDQKDHDFSFLVKGLDVGFSFLCQYERKGLYERLYSYCNLKKYQTKTKKWIGFGKYTKETKFFIDEFIQVNFEWEYDSELEKLVKQFLPNS